MARYELLKIMGNLFGSAQNAAIVTKRRCQWQEELVATLELNTGTKGALKKSKTAFYIYEMKKYINIIVGGVAAGAMIAVAAALYLKVGGFYGAIMFSIGLLTILWYGFNLYTGKIGQLLVNRNPL